MDYKIVAKPTTKELEDEVNAWLCHGWIPFGGLVVIWIPEYDTSEYSQALINNK